MGVESKGTLLPSGYDFAKWLVEMDMDGKIHIPEDFYFTVHSANPVGAKNIQEYLRNYLLCRNRHNREEIQ
ncbi:cyclic-phosphate processing receiver domain-containing protein [Sulfuricurvum sp.]|uniref:cyclic-phosphate processing receiver domain-containing protein n=1 Tax=Sulfuricurvum sp. TaxID=2025608 RepID=UPI003523D5A1